MVVAMQSYTVKEAAPILRLSPASVYALCAAKKLRHQRVGVGRGKILIPADAVDEYLAGATVPSTGATVRPAPEAGSARPFKNLDPDRLAEAWRGQAAG